MRDEERKKEREREREREREWECENEKSVCASSLRAFRLRKRKNV